MIGQTEFPSLAHMIRFSGILLIIAGAALLSVPQSSAQELNGHAIYERACNQCHERHAGDFAHATLTLKNDAAVSLRTGKNVENYLFGGHGNLTSDEAAAMSALLAYILGNDGLFHSHCRICHGPARFLARSKLFLKDGVLIGRYTGRNIQEFLYGHGRVSKDEAEKLTEVLSGFRKDDEN